MTSSLALGAARCRVKCRQRHRRARNRASKNEFRAPTECSQREGHTGGNDIASSQQARRSPRAVRTSRNCTRENRETSLVSIGVSVDRAGKPQAQSGRARWRGVELGHSTCEAVEQSWCGHRPRRQWREGPGPRRTSCNLPLARLCAGSRVSHGLRGVRDAGRWEKYLRRLASTPDAERGHIQGKNRMQ